MAEKNSTAKAAARKLEPSAPASKKMPAKKLASWNGIPDGPSTPWTWHRCWRWNRKPWEEPGLSTQEQLERLCSEAKASLYALHQQHVLTLYGYEGWPTHLDAWAAMDAERDALFSGHERMTIYEGKREFGIRYGTTYSVARGYWQPPWSNIHVPTVLAAEVHQLNNLKDQVLKTWYIEKEVLNLLATHDYKEELKVEMQNAFASLDVFAIGVKEGEVITKKLTKDERGRKAIEQTTSCLNELRRTLNAIINEPFGIVRDFDYLKAAMDNALNRVSVTWNEGRGLWLGLALHQREPSRMDTRGASSYDIYQNAENAARTAQQQYPPGTAVMQHWVPAYLEKVRLIAERWTNRDELDEHLGSLIAAVKGWTMMDLLNKNRLKLNITANELEVTERAKLEVVDGLKKLQGELFPIQTQDIMPVDRIEWEGSTIEFITIMKMLIKRKYVELPSSGGKQGEGNVAEFIRRFQQTFIVRKEDETEFTTDGLADRWRGKPIGLDREPQFDIPDATRKRPRT